MLMTYLLALAAPLHPPISAQTSDALERWRRDIAVARDEFLPKDRSYPPDRRVEARARLDRLSREVAFMTDQEIVAELARVAALAENAHTRVYLLRNRGWWRRYPIRIWRFSDGWRVVATRPGHEALLGARIVKIDGRPVERAEAAVRSLFAGPPTWAAYMASYSLTSPDALLGTHVIQGSGDVDFGLVKGARRFTIRLAGTTEPKRTVPEESWWFLSPRHQALTGWSQVLSGRPLPPYLSQPNRWYDLQRCDANIAYLPFSRAEDQPGRPTLAEFGRTALAQIAATPRVRVVLDLRFNTGGNLQKTQSFFEQLARSAVGQTRGRLFVITGATTFSAGITPVAILKQASRATFVGTPPGDWPRFWAEGGNVVLPNSGITMHYADRAHVYAVGGPHIPKELVYLQLKARDLLPSVPVASTFRDYIDGRDAAAERIVQRGLRCDIAKL